MLGVIGGRRAAGRQLKQDWHQHQARPMGGSHQKRPRRQVTEVDAHAHPARVRGTYQLVKPKEYQCDRAGKSQEIWCDHGLRQADDRHDTGIFSWSYLRELGDSYAERWAAYQAALLYRGLSRDP